MVESTHDRSAACVTVVRIDKTFTIAKNVKLLAIAIGLEVVLEIEESEDVFRQTFLERLPSTFWAMRPVDVLYELGRDSFLDEVSDMRMCGTNAKNLTELVWLRTLCYIPMVSTYGSKCTYF
jgi:hypothetical protein